MDYLVQYRADGEPFASIMSMRQIANLIGFRDCNETSDFVVYRLISGRDPERLEFEDRPCKVYLYDRYSNLVDAEEYDDH